MKGNSFEDLAEVYKALADKTRLHMLALVGQEELCVCELVSILGLSQPAVSQHLRKLRQAGLIKERKNAQWVFYRLDEGTSFPLLADIIRELPDVRSEIQLLKAQGLRVQCNLT